jgi:uncharacterized membrane protein
MNAFLLSLLAPALWAASNHFNKYLVSRFMPRAGVGAIVIFAASVGVLVLPVSFFLQREALNLKLSQSLIIALNGLLYLCALTPFLQALKRSDASAAIPILQTIPVFSFVLARIFLGEVLTVNQIIGGLIVILGALIISSERRPRDTISIARIRLDVLGLMLLAALIYATTFTLFKAFALKVEFWSMVFWESVGFITYLVLLLIFAPTYRQDFLLVFPSKRLATTLAIINEVINIAAKILFNSCSLLVPITMAWIGVSFQSVFVVLYSIILAALFPHISNEAVSGRALYQKLSAIALMILGAWVMNFSS